MKNLRGQCGESLHWHINPELSHLSIEGSGPMWDYTMENSISTHPWSNSIVSVSLPEGITHIGDYAFDHTRLSGSINVPNTVTSIGVGAFMYTDIRVIQLNEGIQKIDSFAFYGTSMSILSIPNTVRHLGGWSIGAVGILHIPTGLDSLGMSYVHLSNTPTYLCERKPAKIVLHGDYPQISWSQWWPAFRDYCGDVFCPDNWTDLPQLEQYYPEDEVLQMWIPYDKDSMPWMEKRIRRGVCGRNLSWKLDGDFNLKIVGVGPMFDFNGDCPCPWPKEISSVTFQEGITHIGAFSFEECRICGEVTFPNTLKSIGESAFAGTQLYGTLSLPDNLESIGKHAFASTHISKLTMGKKLKTIGKGAFSQTYLKEVFLPESLKTIENFAFWGYPSYVERIVLPSGLLEIGIDKEYGEYDWYLFGRGYRGPTEVYLYGAQPTNWEKWKPVFAYMRGSVFYPDDWEELPDPQIYFNKNSFEELENFEFAFSPTGENNVTLQNSSEFEKESIKQKWIPYPSELMRLNPEQLIKLRKTVTDLNMK